MRLPAGSSIGTYQISELLGSGGMGEVYRARDSRLKREVAIKVLPERFVHDPERLARFQREAEILASINHPHIAGIHSLEHVDGCRFLVLELVEGETLADRLRRGPIPIAEALSIAIQIASALEAAHEKGIVHRDLKPANIKLSPDDRVKVLDFGLAKVRESEAAAMDSSDMPTMPAVSMSGMILGTAAYMSPEQARGEETDRTADVWSFGCVLYEMLTARAVFEGRSTAEILAGVIKTDPDWRRLPEETPFLIRRLLKRCLQKEHSQRFRCVGDAGLEISDVLNGAAEEIGSAPSGKSRRERIAWTAVAVASLLAIVAIAFSLRPTPAAVEMRVDIATPASSDLTSLAISPDGLELAFVAGSETSVLWLRALSSGAARPLMGTAGAAFPFWSPDSRSLGFFAGGKLKRIDMDSGLVTTLADAAGRGGTWNADGVILFAPGATTPIYRVSADGGKSVPVTRLQGQPATHRQPQFLPDGRHFLFWGQDGGVETRAVYAADLDGSEPRRILESDVAAVYSRVGELLFFRDGLLFAQPFDAARLTLSGTPALVAEQVLVSPGLNVAAISVSAGGRIAYRTGAPAERQLVWFDRAGTELQTVGDVDKQQPKGVSLSRDGRYVAQERTVDGNIDVWLVETTRGVLTRLTSGPLRERWPQWSSTGGSIAFSANAQGSYDLYTQSVDAGGTRQLLLTTPEAKTVTDWSSDGRFMLYKALDPKTRSDLWALSPDDPQKRFPVVQTEFEDINGQFSPDGKWIAYESNASGRFEVYVQPFPGPGRSTRVSVSGGAQPRWQPGGKALFYIALDNRLMEAPLRFGVHADAEPGAPVSLFTTRVGGALQTADTQQYAVSADGRRFLMNVVTREAAISPITIVLNRKPLT